MKIVETYSHLNGLEYLLVHKPKLWDEIKSVVKQVNGQACKTKVSKEKTMKGRLLYSPIEMNKSFKTLLESRKWEESRVSYWVTKDEKLIRKTLTMPPQKQKEEIEQNGFTPIFSYNQTDFVKDRVAIEVQFGKYSFVSYDLFVKHMLFYSGGVINLGIEILPTKKMQSKMSSGVAYFEGEVYNVMRQGRNNPPVPLLILGIEPM